jgi:hypothetical protein
VNAATRQLVHFDHSFKSELHTAKGAYFADTFGACAGGNRAVQLTLRGSALEIMEDVLTNRKVAEVSYSQVRIVN